MNYEFYRLFDIAVNETQEWELVHESVVHSDVSVNGSCALLTAFDLLFFNLRWAYTRQGFLNIFWAHSTINYYIA